jgi:hypothetical protein
LVNCSIARIGERGIEWLGFWRLAARFGTEERCIEHLAEARWPESFVCSGWPAGSLAAKDTSAGL